ncbi:PadR family transcriptional regulator [Proteus vulgaris]|uniref:PadR family transcriptional regulator n=1 Tax=Proteus TaxID=583 RepID=UPI000F510018|nr:MULTISPECIES: PadR family transcriptional regulator [Proteus]AYY80701.1 PadR family transcriptional regulator [Proteus vulgaris]MBG5969621.1 PadR family transcriptional regulator [Proteus vulgaris]MBG5983430.1 PadR family transcriptional regulator [Proteus vulgaris]MBI6510058.1 PadR family transcriptional regulator [Proteus sp. PR00174]MCH4254566.1 PadR family transcriptional regulator [Proteus vulgaris]
MMIRALQSLYQQRADNGEHGSHGHGKGCCGGKGKQARHHESRSEHCCHGEHEHGHKEHGECRHGEHSHGQKGQGECCHGKHSHGQKGQDECCHGKHDHGHEGHGECYHGEHSSEGQGKRRGRGCGGRGKGRQLKRMFDHGDLRVLLLSMIAKKPSHGYEIIREIDEASSGLYVPSPGVIYPTLTLLEEQDLLVASIAEKGRKNYSITPEGTAFLAEHQEIDTNIQRKLAYARDLSQNAGGVSEEIESAVGKLKAVLRHKLVLKELSVERAGRIASILNEAVEKIEAINEALISEEREDE